MKSYYADRQQPEPQYVPGTGRRIMSVKNGVQLERCFIYLPQDTWSKLRTLGVCHGVSDSMIVQQLVEIACATHP